ncbi:MAG TPA: GlsB/YeaQ/YmgE family stress response membrane protein [Rhodanobacteraceae bacterium]
MLHWLWVFIIGLIIGIIAKWIMPGKDPGGFIVTAIIGIIGSFIGGFIGKLLFGHSEGGLIGFILAIIGALILLWLYRQFFVKAKAG